MITQEILFIFDNKTQMLFDGKKFHEFTAKNTKEYFTASALASTEIKTYGFKIPKSTSSHKIEIQAEIKMFDEANLDPEIEYKIASLTIPLENNEDNYIESYAVKVASLQEKFGDIVKKDKQLDALFPSYLSYIALYSFELLQRKNDLFIHFGDDESYAVIFKDGHYISTRVLPSINEMANRVGIHLVDMKRMLSTKGLDSSLYLEEEFIQMGNIEEEISKIVEKISHTIGHKRGIFKLESLDRIYLDFEGNDIPGFLNLFENFGYENVKKELLNIFPQVDVGRKHQALQALYALGDIQEKHKLVNLTIFERKPSFIETNVGQFSIVLLLSLSIAVIYPIYATFSLDRLTTQENSLKSSVAKLKQESKNLQQKVQTTKTEKIAAQKEFAQKSTQLETYDKTVDTLLNFDKEALVRQKMFKEINLAMRKYALSSNSIEYNKDGMVNVQIISKYDKRDNIAKFIKDLLSKHYSHVETNKVERFENHYESIVEIHR